MSSSAATKTAICHSAPLTHSQRVLAWFLASISGAAILAHAFARLPMTFTVFFGVLPTGLLLAGVVLVGRQLHSRLNQLSTIVVAGCKWGLIGTLAYDAIRPVLKWVIGFSFNPYKAIPYFGHMMTNLPVSDPRAIAAGWLYHFWNGVTFAVMFAVLRPKGGVFAGIVWAMILQAIMMIVYPAFLQVRLSDPGFLISGLVGHAVWGAVVGAGLRRRHLHARSE
jgi:hypothetical protein